VTFTDPEIAHVGASESEARAAHGRAVRVVRRTLAHTDRAVCEGDDDFQFDGFEAETYRRLRGEPDVLDEKMRA
jgi:pyruvate/2-oxoglutarate dehydrogenase complex dihydrolipoamide dehydrogenase (E3) component